MPTKPATLGKCVKCSVSVRCSAFCSQCKASYHPACFLQVPGARVDNDGKLYCCGGPASHCDRCGQMEEEIDCLRNRLSKANERCLDASLAGISEQATGDVRDEDVALERVLQTLRQMQAEIVADVACLRADFCELKGVFEGRGESECGYDGAESLSGGGDGVFLGGADESMILEDIVEVATGDPATVKKQISSRPRILLLGDSQGRSMCSKLLSLFDHKFDIVSIFKPNARLRSEM